MRTSKKSRKQNKKVTENHFTKLGHIQQKVLLVMISAAAFGSTPYPWKQAEVLRVFKKEWKEIDYHRLKRAVEPLKKAKLIKQCEDGAEYDLTLTEEGRKMALEYSLRSLNIERPKKWDGKWHMVIFDVPEKFRYYRNRFRSHLKTLGLLEIQKSVFVHPFNCRPQIEQIIDCYNLHDYVRIATLDNIDYEENLKEAFELV